MKSIGKLETHMAGETVFNVILMSGTLTKHINLTNETNKTDQNASICFCIQILVLVLIIIKIAHYSRNRPDL